MKQETLEKLQRARTRTNSIITLNGPTVLVQLFLLSELTVVFGSKWQIVRYIVSDALHEWRVDAGIAVRRFWYGRVRRLKGDALEGKVFGIDLADVKDLIGA